MPALAKAKEQIRVPHTPTCEVWRSHLWFAQGSYMLDAWVCELLSIMFLAVPERSLAMLFLPTLHCSGYRKVSMLGIGILVRHRRLPGCILLGQH